MTGYNETRTRTLRSLVGDTAVVGRTLRCFEQLDSTNLYLKRAAAEGAPDGLAVLADAQTAGRGRRGRSFQSAGGKGLYLSVLLRPPLTQEALLPLTGLCAVSVCDAVEEVTGTRPQIKWTNDLVLRGRKLGGILTELVTVGARLDAVVIGIGLNVSQQADDFSGEVAGLATSLSLALGREFSRDALAAALLHALDRLYAALLAGDTAAYLAAYRRDCVTLGREVQLLWQDVREKVTALDVDEQFGLVVRRGDGRTDVIRTGEVSVRGLYGYIE